ncbi:MAG: hypothetical protein AAF654_11380 [Myxococcota bacterium]
MKNRVLSVAAVAALGFACGDDEADVGVGDGAFSIAITTEASVCGEPPTEPSSVKVTSAQISGDTLTVSVEFPGGCDSHRFDLCWNGGWTRSDPPRFGLWLVHETNDICEALLSEALTFDLAPIESAYYANGLDTGVTDEVLLTIGDELLTYATDGIASDPSAEEACAVGGCNSELCAPSSVVAELATTCVALPEYECLEDAVCERQMDGRCGWTYSDAALQCLNSL